MGGREKEEFARVAPKREEGEKGEGGRLWVGERPTPCPPHPIIIQNNYTDLSFVISW